MDKRIGKFLGEGANRRTYEYKLDQSLVIKFEHSRIKANQDEYNTYSILKRFGLEEYVAPCSLNSDNSLLMTKGIDLTPGKYEIPSVFFPTNLDNYKSVKGRTVLIDYDWRIREQNGFLFWYMPPWDFESIADTPGIENAAHREYDLERVLSPQEQYNAPEDQTAPDYFVALRFDQSSVREWFQNTRIIEV